MAAPKVELGWDNSDLQAGAAKAQGILSGFATRARGTLGRAMSADVVGGFGQLTAALGSLAGLKAVIDDFDRLNDLAVQLDTSVESLQRLGAMAKLSGSDVETLVKGVSKLTRSLADAEGSEKTAEALRALGVSASQLRTLSLEEQVLALSDAFINARARGEGFAEVFDLMGRNGAELIPLLVQGREELQALADTPVLSQEQVQRLADFNDQLDAGVLKLKAWTADALLGLSDVAAVTGAALFGGFEGDFSERFDAAARALAQSKIEAEEAAAAQERQRQAAREAADEAKKIAAAQKAAAESIEKGQKELEAQEKRMQGIREQIDQAKESNLKQQLSPEENLEYARGKAADLEAKMKAAREKAYLEGMGGQDTEEILQLELQRQRLLGEILLLEEQISGEKERQQKAEAEKKAQQNEARAGIASDLQVLDLRARGRTKEADALEKQLRIQAEAKRIAVETGLSQEEALRIAQARSDLEDKAARRGERTENGRKRIMGFSRRATGLPDFGGLAEFDALQERDSNGRFKYAAFYRGNDRRFQTGTPPKSAHERAGEMLRGRAAANQTGGRGSDSVKLTEGNQIVQLLTEIREGIGEFTAV
jgi:hypothetical protein